MMRHRCCDLCLFLFLVLSALSFEEQTRKLNVQSTKNQTDADRTSWVKLLHSHFAAFEVSRVKGDEY
jgi:hypothetical protein